MVLFVLIILFCLASDNLTTFFADPDFGVLAIIETNAGNLVAVGTDQGDGRDRQGTGQGDDVTGLFALFLDVLFVEVFAFDDNFVLGGVNLDDFAGLVFVFTSGNFDGVVELEFKHSL